MNKILIPKIFLFLCVFFSLKMHAQVNCVNENFSSNVTSPNTSTSSRRYPNNNDLYPLNSLLTGYGGGNNFIFRFNVTGAPSRLKVYVDLSVFGPNPPSTDASMTIHSACPATMSNRIASFTGGSQSQFITFPTNGDYYFVFDEGATTDSSYCSLQITKAWETVQAGDWNSSSTWRDGIIPDTSFGFVTLNHNVFINSPAVKSCGGISTGVNTLTINNGASLTTGTSSMGTAFGNSNRSFVGNLTMDGGTFNINGGFTIANFNLSGGTINIDPNDGAGTNGSIWSTPAIQVIGTQNVTGGNINILDPQYAVSNGFVNDCVINYNGGSNVTWGEGCTVTFGGGDDKYNGSVEGYEVSCRQNYGMLTFGSVVVATGTAANSKPLTVFSTLSCINLTVNAGSEIVSLNNSIYVRKNLINNGVITSGDFGAPYAGSTRPGIAFAKEVFQRYNPAQSRFYNDFVAADYPQSISGTGFFRNSLTAPIPTSQQDNNISNLQVYNLRENGGLTLNMPLKTERLNLGTGKINTTITNLLTLGLGTDNASTSNVAEGILYAMPLTELSTTTNPTSIANWNTGWVDGPFRRWFRSANNSGEKTIMPVGDPADAQVCSVQFTTAPTTAGYIISKFIKAPPTGGRNINLTDPAVSNSISYIADYGYWDVAPTATTGVAGGAYTSSFLGKSFNANGAHPDFVQLKRPSGSLLASDWALPGVHVASSNMGGVLVSRTGQMGFSEFAIGENLIPLANNFIILLGSANNNNNILTLKISNVEAGAKIELLKGFTNQTILTVINSKVALNNITTYSFEDFTPINTTNFYKVKITSNNGAVKYSNVVLLNAKIELKVKAFPNPSKSIFNVSYFALNDDKVQYKLIDALGKIVFSQNGTILKGNVSNSLNFNNIAVGSYTLSIKLKSENKPKLITLIKN